MIKRIIAVWAFLLVLLSGAFADDYLLMRSIQTSSYEELVRMSSAYGLDASMEESDLRQNLLDYFGLAEQQTEIDVSESYSATAITIDNSDSLYSLDSAVILSGNVKLSFRTESDDADRTLTAQKVVVDIESKRLEASGIVRLESEEEQSRTFEGQAVVLDWSNLDIVVFEGASSQSRTNASGAEVVFLATGQRISYSGQTSSILFKDGTIATTLEDPYWSISAKQIAFSDSDLFIDNATFRLGRVPIFYFPIFFYPGTTLAFNPAMGFSSSKGAFLNTTTEIYGKYPGLGRKDSKDDEADVSASIVSLLSSEQQGETIRDGLYYRPLQDGEQLGDLESWARSSASYMAIFADAYEDQGTVLGLDTVNNLLSNKIRISALGAIGYKAVAPSEDLQRLRYSLDFRFKYSDKGLSIEALMPAASDPFAKRDYLNRNTVFGLDSVFGREQDFPSNYSEESKYTRSISASYSKTLGNYTFKLNSLKADIDYKLERKLDSGKSHYGSTVVEASLPYLSLSSNGKFLDLKSDAKTVTTDSGYTNQLASEFEEQRLLLDAQKTSKSTGELSYLSGPDLKLSQTTRTEGAALQVGYTYFQTLDNIYVSDMVHDRFYTKVNGTLYVKANAPASWLSVSETVKPSFNFSENKIGKPDANTASDLSLDSALEASIPKLGVTYVLNQKVYSHNTKHSATLDEVSSSWGSWTKESVTAHNLTISEHFGIYNLGLYVQFRPLTEIIRPSAGFAVNGFKLNANFSFERKDATFEKGVGNLDLSYTSQMVKATLANKYDFKFLQNSSDGWAGYSVKQSVEVHVPNGLVLSENAELERKLEFKNLKFAASYTVDVNHFDLSGAASLSFKGQDLKKDVLALSVKANTESLVFWKGRIRTSIKGDLSFNYDFDNPYRSSLSAGYTFNFSIAEFVDLGLSITSANKSFSRYFTSGKFVFGDMMHDLIKSFDFFGDGRKSTGFNLSSFKLQLVHYMRDWNLYIDAVGKLTTQYSGRYEWVPQVTVYVKWNVLPELKVEGSWDSYNREWK